MPEATKVLYDVSQAIKELEKLNKKVEESGDAADKAFNDTRSITGYDKELKRLAASFGGTESSAQGLLTTLGGSTIVLAAAAAGVASIAANVADLNTLFRDTSANLDGFIEAIDKIRDARESVSTFGDVAAQRNIELAQRAVRLDRADLADEQNSVEAARDAARKRLDIVREEVRRRERIVKDGLDREADLRKRLADRTRENAADQFGGPAPKRVIDLAAAAEQAAFEGNIDLAEELLDAAKQQSDELGNHVFFLKAIDNANNSINSALEKQIQTQSNINQNAQTDLNRLKGLEAALDADLEKNEEKLRIIQRQNRELGRQLRILRDASLEQRNLEQADAAARGIQTRAQGVNEFIRGGLESGFESFNRAVEDFKQSVTGGTADLQAVDTFSAAFIRSLEPILELTQRIQRGENVTAQDFEAVQGDILTASKFEAIIGKALQEGRVNENRVGQVEQFRSTIQQILGLNEELARFRRVRGDVTPIREGSIGPTRDDMRSLRDAVLKLRDTISQPSRSNSAVPPATSATSQGTPQPATNAVSSNITVNANVKGGIIDAETTREITRIIRQELRKQTSQAPVV